MEADVMAEEADVTADLVVRLDRTAGDERRAARALLASTAARCAGVQVSSVTLDRTASGAPLLGGGAVGLHASLSHSRGLIAVAVCRLGPVGVDVEGVRPLPALALSRRWYAPEDTEWLLQQPEERVGVEFLSLWTGKEAVGKVYRTGLRGGRILRHRIAPPRAYTDALCWQPTTDDPGVIVAHRELPGFLLAVASGPAVCDARVRLSMPAAGAYSSVQGDSEPGSIASNPGNSGGRVTLGDGR
jgi:4'-phosphopantetheinyl transferase